MFFAKSPLSIVLAILSFFMLALSVSALPIPNAGSQGAPSSLLGRTYSQKPNAPSAKGIMISRSPAPEPDALEDETLELLTRNERFQRRTQLNRRSVARHAAAASLQRRSPDLKPNTIQLVARSPL